MRTTSATAFLICLLPLLAAAPLDAQGPEPMDRFTGLAGTDGRRGDAPSLQTAIPPAALHRGVDPARTALGTAVGMATGVGVAALLYWFAPGLPGCCHPWQANLLLVPIAVMPALGAHDGSGRSGRLPITLAASTASVGAAYLALRGGSSGGRHALLPLALLQLITTTMAELATADALAPAPDGR